MADGVMASYEKTLLEYVSKDDSVSFLLGYSLYLINPPDTQNTLFLKSYALMCHLSENNLVEFHKLLQSVDYSNYRNPYVEFVLAVYDYLLQHDGQSLKKLSSTCDPELSGIMNKIYNKHCELLKCIKSKNIENSKISEEKEDDRQNIVDSVYVVKNFLGN